MTPLTRHSLGSSFVGIIFGCTLGSLGPPLVLFHRAGEPVGFEIYAYLYAILFVVSFFLMLPIALVSGALLVRRLAARWPQSLPITCTGLACAIGAVAAPLLAAFFILSLAGVRGLSSFFSTSVTVAPTDISITVFELSLVLGTTYATIAGLATGIHLLQGIETDPSLQPATAQASPAIQSA